MTEDERAALVDEIAQRLAMKKGKAWDKFHEEDRVEVGAHYVNGKDFFCMQARELMPTIDRLLAERDIDALLDGVSIKGCKPGSVSHMVKFTAEEDGYRARLNVMGSKHTGRGWYEVVSAEHYGTGPRRMAAIRDAVAKAKGERQ